jgi:uncharacterized protein (DUF2164 family)
LDIKIELNEEKRASMISEIKDFFRKERDEDLGDLASALILDFFMEKLAPVAYNQGVYDSCQYMRKKVEDLLEIQKY